MIDKLKSLNIINDELKSIYEFDEYTLTELLCQFYKSISDVIDECNILEECYNYLLNQGLPLEVQKEITNMFNDGRLEHIINEVLFEKLNNKIDDIEKSIKDYENLVVNNDWTLALETALNGYNRIYFPKGEYILNNVKIPSNVTIEGCGDDTIFKTTSNTMFNLQGTIEDEINITSDIEDFSTIINADTTTLNVNDYLLIKGQRDCLNYDDSGDNWCLGYATPNSQGCYFGEFIQIENIENNQITLYGNLTFPNYLSHNSNETSTNARECTTIQKVNFKENITLKNFKVIGDINYVFNCLYSKNIIIDNVNYIHEGYNDGSRKFINFKNCYKCLAINCNYLRTSTHLPSDHYYLNMYTIGSSQYCVFDNCTGDRATQLFDISYFATNICSSNNTIKNCTSINATQTGICTHGGTYKVMILNNRVFSSKQGICCRTKSSVISGNLLEGQYGLTQFQYGIALYEGHATECVITNNNISNFGTGIVIVDGVDLGETFRTCNAIISNNTINNCYMGIGTRTESNHNRETILNIMIKNNTIKMFNGAQAIHLDVNTTGVTIEGNIFQFPTLTSGTRGVWLDYDCNAIRMYTNVYRNCDIANWCRGRSSTSIPKIELKYKDNIFSYCNTKYGGSASGVRWENKEKERYLIMEPIYSTGDYTSLEGIPKNTLFINSENRLCFKDVNGKITALYIPTE